MPVEQYSFNKRVENLIKSYFNDSEHICYELDLHKINIQHIDKNNLDSATLELKKNENNFQVYFWDGYSQSEVIEVKTEKDAVKTLKRFMKKLTKILNR